MSIGEGLLREMLADNLIVIRRAEGPGIKWELIYQAWTFKYESIERCLEELTLLLIRKLPIKNSD